MPSSCANRLTRALITDRRGVTAAEYAILAVGIVIVVGSAVTFLNDPVFGVFQAAGNTITSTLNALRSSGSASLPVDAALGMAQGVVLPGADLPASVL